MNSQPFTETLEWLAFSVPQATVDEVRTAIGREWFETETGFSGYPTSWLTTNGRQENAVWTDREENQCRATMSLFTRKAEGGTVKFSISWRARPALHRVMYESS